MTVNEEFLDLVTMADERCGRFATRPFIGERVAGAWRWTTFGAFHDAVVALAAGLARLGVGAGDRVAIVAPNGSAWATAAYATYRLGAAFVPMYEAQRPAEWRFIVADSGAKVAIASTAKVAAELEAGRADAPALRHVLRLDGGEGDAGSVAAVIADGRAHPRPPAPAPAPDALAGLVYTSGTTGQPKGAMLTHRNLASNVAAAIAVFPIAPEDRSVSFLPWAHAYGQVVELHILLACGASTAINRDVEHLVDDLAEVRPTVLVAVPRIFNRIHDGVLTQMAARPPAIRHLFEAGLAAAIKRRRGEHLSVGERVVRRLADRLIFAKVRGKTGGRLRYAISASATLSPATAEFIDALGIPVYEGYGLTETSPVVSTNRPGARRMGSVGRPIPGVTVRIDGARSPEPGEGEIVVYGPNVMQGYHARPDETRAALDADGGLRTGDLGHVDGDGYLYVTGRIKEQYKLENGKYVMPAPLEEAIAGSPFVRSVMLYGAGKPFNVALIALDLAAVKAWAAREGVELGDDPTASPAVRALIEREIATQSEAFRAYERPRAFALIGDEFTIASDLLTPSLKLKRRNAVARYGALLEALYPARGTSAKGASEAAGSAAPAAR